MTDSPTPATGTEPDAEAGIGPDAVLTAEPGAGRGNVPSASRAPHVPSVGIITAANFPDGDPTDRANGLASTLELISAVEDLGYDTAGVRQRQLERGSSSALTVLAAAGQRTRRIGLETSVVPLGFEIPFRLAEDVATVDALSGGRLTVGVSTSAPHHALLTDLNRPDFSPDTDAYDLLDRFLAALRGEALVDEPLATPYGAVHSPAVLPTIPDAASRVWPSPSSEASAWPCSPSGSAAPGSGRRSWPCLSLVSPYLVSGSDCCSSSSSPSVSAGSPLSTPPASPG